MCAASKPKSSWYPTRLVDVGTKGDTKGPRLILTSQASMNGPYITLSHCWGGVSPLTLTTKTLDQFVQGIDPALVPTTFSDAFKVTRALGIRYIWIDSLCIIQDSLKDWEYEAGTMLQAYRYAYCNIAATHAQNSHQGLFRSRNPKSLSAVLHVTGKGIHGLFELCRDAQWQKDIEEAPLNSRAWVVQERYISDRILHFGADQIYWDCYQSQNSESNFQGDHDDWTAMKKNDGPIHILDDEFLQKWENIVKQYTTSALTFPEKDKIIAISSLIQHLEASWKIECHAGLWRRRFEVQLCWEPSARHFIQEPKEFPAMLRAPSWSWLSYDSDVSISNYSSERTFNSIIEVQVRQTTNLAGNQILQGYIDLRCVLVELALNKAESEYSLADPKLSSSTFYYTLDYPARQLSTAFFVPLYSVIGSESIEGLVVRQSDTSSGSYVRFGIGHIWYLSESDETYLLSTIGKEKFPCVDFDPKTGHLIRLV
jgi:hypothetical protein